MDSVWIIYNSSYISDVYQWHIQAYTKAVEEMGMEAVILSSSSLRPCYGEKGIWGAPKQAPKFVIFYDKDITLAAALESQGFAVYNSSRCIRLCDDKALTYQKLWEHNLPLPLTMPAPQVYKGGQNTKQLFEMAVKIGYPIIVKECFGSLGQQVYLAKDESQLADLAQKVGEKPFVLQRFIAGASGRDKRILVASGRVIAAVERINENDFRSNAGVGGKVYAYAPTQEEMELAICAAKTMGAIYAGIDILTDYDAKRYICEVNSNPQFMESAKKIDINIANYIVKCLMKKLSPA